MMESIFKAINKFAGNYKTLDFVAVFFARWLPYLMIAFMFFYFYQKDILLFFSALVSGGIGRGFNEVAHIFYKKQRPAHIEGTKVLIPVPNNYSFPSGHSSFLFGVSFFVFAFYKEVGIIFLALSFMVGVARVFCGVHWFRDILGGVLMGFVSAMLVSNILIQ